jgi:[calcium/calmodulin-dependent protein kinase] kinase
MLSSYQQSASETDVPNLTERMYAASILDDRPSTATRTPEGRTPASRVYPESTPESFARAQEQLERRRKLEEKAEEETEHARQVVVEAQSEAASSCPPSPDDDIFHQKQEEEARRAKSSSSVGSVGLTSPITSPSDVTSPISSMNYSSVNLVSSSDQAFPSDPSLPTLISGASSVSADHEGDFLAHPGVIREPVEVTGGTPDTLTPPLLSKEPSHDSEPPSDQSGLKTLTVVADEDEGYNADGDLAVKTEDDDDSDSDEGLTMTRRKPTPPKRAGTLVRRDTNASVASTETAKKVYMAE